MSQNPPPPPSFGPVPTPGSGGGQYGQPPVQQYGGPMQPTRTSAAAVISLICGILGCFIITAVIAIITGIMGLSATKNPNVKGRGLAITGLILGILFGLGGSGCLIAGGGAYIWGNAEANKGAAVVDTALLAASKGDTATFKSCLEPGAFTDDQIQSFVDTVQPWGTPGKFQRDSEFNVRTVNGSQAVEFKGKVAYPTDGTKEFDVRAVKVGSDYKLQNLTY